MASSTRAWSRWTVELDGAAVQVGEEAEVPPVGPELLLGSDEPGAAHDEAFCLVGGLGHLGDAVFGVVDADPGVLVDLGDGLCDCPVSRSHRHRVGNTETCEGLDGVVGPEPRVDPQHDLTWRPGAAAPCDELLDKAPRPTGGVG